LTSVTSAALIVAGRRMRPIELTGVPCEPSSIAIDFHQPFDRMLGRALLHTLLAEEALSPWKHETFEEGRKLVMSIEWENMRDVLVWAHDD
jgi:hypothetical protein